MNVFDELDKQKEKEEIVSDLPQRFVAPAASGEIPRDGMLEYVTVEKIADVVQASPANTVYLFSDRSRPVLKCITEYYELFGFAPVLLTGVPGLEYGPSFENDTWSLPRAAYHATINDIAEFARKAELAAAEKTDASIYGREQARITRRSGNIKQFTAFDMPKIAGDGKMIDGAETVDDQAQTEE